MSKPMTGSNFLRQSHRDMQADITETDVRPKSAFPFETPIQFTLDNLLYHSTSGRARLSIVVRARTRIPS